MLSDREIVFNSHQIDQHRIEFDDDGDRISASYNILNVDKYELQNVGEIRVSFKFNKKRWTIEILIESNKN